MTTTIAQISDTHLSDDRPYFNANFERLAEALRAAKPDLVINTGDATLDGCDREADLRRAKAMHDALGLPYHVIPGNHDTGDSRNVGSRQAIDDVRRERYLEVFGADRWSRDVPGWRLVGINAQLLDSGLAAEAEQAHFLRDALAGAPGRAVALFLHKPLFQHTVEEPQIGGWFLTHQARNNLLGLIAGADVRLIASGHLHLFRQTTPSMRHVWAPSTSFILPDYFEPDWGPKVVGYVEHRLHTDGRSESRLVEPPGMVRNDMQDFPGAYGDIRARALKTASHD
ncbi:MAG: metallophosphoesterase [Alphaproteobacteria bacterium]|nr:metallophosphoesterase [Alphaproteobacteria bacterium]MCW5739276.1 metallophosphoesterase [Alphaproteobacteria bacterium]